MYDEQIDDLNKWFDKMKLDSRGTYHHTEIEDGEDIYVVSCDDVKVFCDFLRENIIDMSYFPCKVNEDGIFFFSKDLEKACFY